MVSASSLRRRFASLGPSTSAYWRTSAMYRRVAATKWLVLYEDVTVSRVEISKSIRSNLWSIAFSSADWLSPQPPSRADATSRGTTVREILMRRIYRRRAGLANEAVPVASAAVSRSYVIYIALLAAFWGASYMFIKVA